MSSGEVWDTSKFGDLSHEKGGCSPEVPEKRYRAVERATATNPGELVAVRVGAR